LRHVTVVPRGTVKVAGSNLSASVSWTVFAVVPATGLAEDAAGDGLADGAAAEGLGAALTAAGLEAAGFAVGAGALVLAGAPEGEGEHAATVRIPAMHSPSPNGARGKSALRSRSSISEPPSRFHTTLETRQVRCDRLDGNVQICTFDSLSQRLTR
jgi:hypothetical protein